MVQRYPKLQLPHFLPPLLFASPVTLTVSLGYICVHLFSQIHLNRSCLPLLKLKQVLLGRRDLGPGSPERLREGYSRDSRRGFWGAPLSFPDRKSSLLGVTDVPFRTGIEKGVGVREAAKQGLRGQ